jgi:prolyl-tRNA editing enzyme YbaK/EbsC (Cys-tRNA(Pro) deacylase)
MAKGVERFRAATAGLGLSITTHSDSTHTAEEAAAAVGAAVGAIVKSLVFMVDDAPLLVLVSGPNRVDAGLIGLSVGAVLEKADANHVKTHTGFSIGGVPPFGHPGPVRTLMDEDLFAFDVVWAAAGSSTSVFSISPQRLQELSGATATRVC